MVWLWERAVKMAAREKVFLDPCLRLNWHRILFEVIKWWYHKSTILEIFSGKGLISMTLHSTFKKEQVYDASFSAPQK